MYLANTFFTALAFVSWVADTGPHDARAMVIAGDVNALIRRDVTFCSLPAAVAQAPPLHVLPVSTAQHGAGRWGKITEITLKCNCTRLSLQKRAQESSMGFIFFIHSSFLCQKQFYVDDTQLLTVFSYNYLKQTNSALEIE